MSPNFFIFASIYSESIAAIQSKRAESLDENSTAMTALQQLGDSCVSQAESQLPKISSFSMSENGFSVKESTLDAEYADFQVSPSFNPLITRGWIFHTF